MHLNELMAGDTLLAASCISERGKGKGDVLEPGAVKYALKSDDIFFDQMASDTPFAGGDYQRARERKGRRAVA